MKVLKELEILRHKQNFRITEPANKDIVQFREMIKAGGKYLKKKKEKRRLLQTNIFPLTKMGTIPIGTEGR